MAYSATLNKLNTYTHNEHYCTDCDLKFNTVKNESAHVKAYMHFRKVHGVFISLACHSRCQG